MKNILFALAIVFPFTLIAQKKVLDHTDFDIWNTIKKPSISRDGNYVLYHLEKGERYNTFKLKTVNGSKVFEYKNGLKGKFTKDSKFAIFTIEPNKDKVDELKRQKVEKEKLPKDSLGIYNIEKKNLVKFPNLKSYKIPEKWSGYLAYQIEEIKSKKEKDSLKKKSKKDNKDNGSPLVLINLKNKKKDTFNYVTNYTFAKDGKFLAFTTSGENESESSGVYVINLNKDEKTIIYETDKAKYYKLNFSDTGKNLAFVVDRDTTKAQVRSFGLYHWVLNEKLAKRILDTTSSPKNYSVSRHGDIHFSKDESKLYFGLSKPPILKDTSLIEDEIVNVEVWTYNEPRLYTVQEQQMEDDEKESFKTVMHLNKENKLVQIGSKNYPNTILTDKSNANYALISDDSKYKLESQWTAVNAKDYSVINIQTGETNQILTRLSGNASLSPKGKYVYGYNLIDSLWFSYNIKNQTYKELTRSKLFYDELNDSPRYPSNYGVAGWTENDESILIYDRYDIWSFNPEKNLTERLTKGRESNMEYRYVQLDEEEEFISTKTKWILSGFNESNKNSGYYRFDPKSKTIETLIEGPYRFSNLVKAENSNNILFTKESFGEFPNIWSSTVDFKNPISITDANPQQNEYNWGTIELINWTSLDGKDLTGMLVKPENFDPNKKYPMIVNFYEKSSNTLHRHHNPNPGRSTINYSFYASRGYIIFNPDVYYRIGYPGESAFNSVIPGVTSLIEKGFIDKNRIGLQGHSWGGYQIAYLITKTDIFRAAEAGAPVPNMISAYGGIRWETGLSRQFQYEHTQSRIGGTPWQYPSRYIENSPIFNIDKINTPLLVMHNDNDGHVPWYQGIELFVAMRRLNKPSWFLNYNGEPHWPLKLQNRKDFNIRLAQFFDHYLKDKPMPLWMKRGVPAIEKGINQGYDLVEED